ncbi:hypothetical protein DID88_003873 [Monilinia fructigena]|uniref:Uncharacterized protein n=1 Tax=Monilinia fructigena TaxID=38457 RepID=A0A395IVM8_9HELO|nr:hypothetical protein DID88_003873 [Monilinia fructigena]
MRQASWERKLQEVDRRGAAKDVNIYLQTFFKLEEEASQEGKSDVDDEVVDVDDRERRTERLKGALGTLAHLWWQDSIFINEAAEKLADGSRDPKWRVPLGDSDENRARVVESNYVPLIVTQLSDTNLLAFAIPVLYNVCVDYVPAQQQASSSYLSRELITLIASPRFKDIVHFLGYICKLLDLLIQQPSEPEMAPDNTPIVLLRLASDRENPVDMEDYIALVNTAVAYLGHEKFQKTLVQTPQGLDTALAVLVDSYTRFDSHPSIGSSTPHEEDAKLLSQMRINLNSALSDISALPEFKEACPVVSPFSSSLRRWLSSEQIQLQVCACIMLVCRVFTAYKGRPAEELNETRREFLLRHPDLARPLSFMVSQTKWPIVRSEGWFVFALMARYPDSAQCISDMMQDVAVFQPLVEMLTGKPLLDYKPVSETNSSDTLGTDIQAPEPEPVQPHAQAAEMARIDRENALVLVSELLKNRGNEMAVMKRALFEDLLKGGGELVMSYREGKE